MLVGVILPFFFMVPTKTRSQEQYWSLRRMKPSKSRRVLVCENTLTTWTSSAAVWKRIMWHGNLCPPPPFLSWKGLLRCYCRIHFLEKKYDCGSLSSVYSVWDLGLRWSWDGDTGGIKVRLMLQSWKQFPTAHFHIWATRRFWTYSTCWFQRWK